MLNSSQPLRAQDDQPWSARPEVIEKFEKRGKFLYDESQVPTYTLPDPLRSKDGSAVTSKDAWLDTRRGELMELFRANVYGRRPDTAYAMRFEELERQEDVFDGKADGFEMRAVVVLGEREYSFRFVLFVPKSAKAAPAVIHINNRYFIPLKKAAVEQDPFWPARTIVDRGYATASFHTSDVDPDRKDGYAEGVRAFFAEGMPPKDDAWRSLSAWGWAASRVLDYLSTRPDIDSSQVAVVGHSRGGKTSLWAACEDPRFAVAYSNNSGCGGAALSRRAYGETVGRITSSFPHWFCKPFWEFADREAELPVDQHEVMALLAPRGIYVASADEDLWADPKGEYLALREAAPVFRLFGQQSIANPEMPPLNAPRVVGRTGYHIRTGGHGLGEQDWNWFLDFTDRVLPSLP